MLSNLLKRTAVTALKLPVAVVWDCLSLGNMGEGASTAKVLREHQRQKQVDEYIDLIERTRRLTRD